MGGNDDKPVMGSDMQDAMSALHNPSARNARRMAKRLKRKQRGKQS